MLSKRTLAFAVAALGLAVAGSARAQVPDVRQEDRQEDRRADRQEDRRADRQEDRQLDGRDVAIPRNGDGSIDLAKLEADIRARLARDARDVRIRSRDLSAQDRQRLAELAQRLGADLNLDRVRVRQDGERIRIDLREAREGRAERREDRIARAERAGHRAERPERAERAERPERAERAERLERAERVERPERSGHH